MDDEDVGKMLEGIERIAQCPVCLNIPTGPVAQCSNGHISCAPCKEPLVECSLCREPFIGTINRIVEELLNFLPKPCPYTDKGCDAVSLLDNHSQNCEFRPIKCLVGFDQPCKWSNTIRDWKEHVRTEHEEYFVACAFKKPTIITFQDFKGPWQSCCYAFQVDDEFFLFNVWREGNKFCHVLKHIQCKKARQEYYFKVKFSSQEHLFYKSLIESTPLKEDEPLEKNPVVFLTMDLEGLTLNDGSLNAEIEPFQLNMPKKV